MKVKIQESKKMIPKVEITPKAFLDLYLCGVDNFSFVMTLHGMLGQSPSGTEGNLIVLGTQVGFKKQGSTISIFSVTGEENKPKKKAAAKRLIASLGKVLCRDKSAIDISTAA